MFFSPSSAGRERERAVNGRPRARVFRLLFFFSLARESREVCVPKYSAIEGVKRERERRLGASFDDDV